MPKTCPICDLELPNPIPSICPRAECGWDLESDLSIHLCLDLPNDVVNSYRQKLQKARQDWNQRLEAIRRQQELEKELQRLKAEEEEEEKRRTKEEEFWTQCKQRNTVGSYREYQAGYPQGLHESEAAQAIRSLEEQEKNSAEDRFWQEVLGRDCKEGYESYLRTFVTVQGG